MSSDKYEQIEHPLLIDLVVDEIFKNLQRDALLASRLVCRDWLRISTKFFHKEQANVLLSNCDDLYCFLSTFLNCSSPPHTKLTLNFCEIPENDIVLFFNTCYACVEGVSLSPGNRMNIVSIFSILLRCIPQIESLAFEGLREMIVNQVSRSVSRYLQMEIGVNRISEFILWYESTVQAKVVFPKLKRLNLIIQLEAENIETSTAFFASVFKLIPQLESLHVSPLDISAVNTTMPGLMRALQQSTTALIPQLQELRIDDLDNNGILLLTQFGLQLRLKKLSLYALMHDVQESSVEALISSQSENLEELSIGGQYCRGGDELAIRLNTPFCMPQLRSLHFIGGMFIGRHFEYIKTMPWRALEYSKQLPQLEQLGLMYLTNYSMNCIFPDSYGHTFESPCLTVTQIDFTGGVEAIEVLKVVLLGILFPNVTQLNVTVSSFECILEVLGTWPKLKSLSMNVIGIIFNIDTAFTGIRSNAFIKDKMNEPRNEQEEEFFEIDFDSYSVNSQQSIQSLPDLTELKIHFENSSPQWSGSVVNCNSFLSDITGMAGLRLLKKLTHLVINKSVMTKNCLQILHEELNLERCSVGDRHGRVINFRDSADPDEADG